MKNVRLIVEYDGTNYNGWQAQKTVHRTSYIVHSKIKTIQETVEKALEKILRQKVNITAAGRTDSGVHAENQACNFKSNSLIKPDSIKKALNSTLPRDIVIKKAEYVIPSFNSQKDAKSKIYRYRILNQPHRSAILRHFVYYYRFPLDVALMKKEAKSLIGKHNFRSFQAKDIVERYPVVNLKKISVTKRNGLIEIEMEADRFLYNMVRNIVGTLIELGRGYFKAGLPRRGEKAGFMQELLKKKNRAFAGPTAPAKGLTLVKVKY